MVRSLVVTVWCWLDPIYFSLTRLQYICPGQKEKGIFRVRLTKYKGRDIVLSDGIKICKNDYLLKIHLHNIRIIKNFSGMKNELKKGRLVFKNVMESMPLLTDFILNHPEESRIKGIIGITLINKGFRPLGFESILPENKFYIWFKKTIQTPIFLLSKSGHAGINEHRPVYLMMSKEKLMEKYKKSV